jgi:hypothetical protein
VLDFLRAKIGADTAHRKQVAATAQPAPLVALPPQPARRRTRLPSLPDLPSLPLSAKRRSP